MSILDHVRHGVEVHCVYLTDGGYGGQSVQVRMHETHRALALLGVEPGRIHFLGAEHGFRDSELHTRLDAAADAFDAWLSGIGDVDAVHLPAWEGGHQDHDATHVIGAVVAARRGIDRVIQFPLYHGAGLPGPLFRVLAPLPENGRVDGYRANMRERWLAVRLCFMYVSQWRTWVGLLPFFAWRMLVSGQFPEQAVDPARWREMPHRGVPLYERRGFLTYDEFARKAAEFVARNSTCR